MERMPMSPALPTHNVRQAETHRGRKTGKVFLQLPQLIDSKASQINSLTSIHFETCTRNRSSCHLAVAVHVLQTDSSTMLIEVKAVGGLATGRPKKERLNWTP